MTNPFLGLLAVLAALAAQPGSAALADGDAAVAGWQPEQGVAAPSYALATPTTSTLNIDSIVLSCEQGPSRRGLQLRLYLSDDGPLAPVGTAATATLKADPSVSLVVDGVRHAADLLFADDVVILADAADGTLPILSEGLVAALETGRQLELNFDLVETPGGEAAAGQGQATLDLQAGAGGAAIAAVRQCAGESKVPLAAVSRAR